MSSIAEQSEVAAVASSTAAPRQSVGSFLLFWQHRGWLAKVTAAGLVLAALIAFVIPKRYQSTVQLMPPDPQSLSSMSMLGALVGLGTAGAGENIASSLLGMKTPGATFVGILASRTAQDDLINRFDLLRVYGTKRYVDARKMLSKRTDIDEDKRSGTITITVTDGDPYRARSLAGAYVEELDTLVNQLSTSSARRERIFLEERLKACKQALDEDSRALSQFSSHNGMLDVQNQGRAMMDAAGKLQGELIAAQTELRGLETTYSENNVRVRGVRARVAELQRQLQRMGGSGEDANDTAAQTGQLYPSLRKLPLLGATYNDLYQRVKIQEAVYEVLTKQYELAKVQEAKDIPSVKVLDQPDLPEQKSFPPRALIIVLGTLVALFAGMSWLTVGELWRQTDDCHSTKAFVLQLLGPVARRSSRLWPTQTGGQE